MECRHLDGDPGNNWDWNLKWGTKSENAFDCVKHGTHVDNKGERHGMARLTELEVRGIMALWRTRQFLQREIAAYFKTTTSSVGDVIREKSWKYLWDRVTV